MSILEIAIVGAILSGIIQFTKAKLGTSSNQTKIVTVVLALVVGAVIYLFQSTEYWETALGILASASTVYAFLLKK